MKTQIAIRITPVTVLGRSRTGVYHEMRGDYAARCNSRNGIRLAIAQVQLFENASEDSFCKKCFPNGKPVDFEITEIEVQ